MNVQLVYRRCYTSVFLYSNISIKQQVIVANPSRFSPLHGKLMYLTDKDNYNELKIKRNASCLKL